MNRLIVVLTSFLLSSCASWHLSDSMNHPKTIHIPYAIGDSTGEFTRRVISEVSKQPGLTVDDSGQYLLVIKMLDSKEQKLGYRYDPIDLAKDKKEIILNESRALALAEVTLKDTFSNKIVLGPAYILGAIDFDHQQNTINNDTNDFSLGQLTDVETARDVTYIPLYRDLSAKIATWLQNAQEFATVQ
jgi:hypothetical protein